MSPIFCLSESTRLIDRLYLQLRGYLAAAGNRQVNGFAFLRSGEAGYDSWREAKDEFVASVREIIATKRKEDVDAGLPSFPSLDLTWGENDEAEQF